MAITLVSFAMDRGTQLLLGVRDIRRSKATASVHVEGVTGATWLVQCHAAADWLRGQTVAEFTGNDAYNLLEVQAVGWTPGEVVLRAVYGWDHTCAVVGKAFDQASESSFTTHQRLLYRRADPDHPASTSYLAGSASAPFSVVTIRQPTIDWTDEGTIPLNDYQGYVKRDEPIHQIMVPFTVLDTDDSVVDESSVLWNHVNTDAVTVNRATREPGTLLFRGFRAKGRADAAEGNPQAGHLLFHWTPLGWWDWSLRLNYKTEPVYEGNNTLPSYRPNNTARLLKTMPYKTAAFANAFTVNATEQITGPDADTGYTGSANSPINVAPL